MVDNNVRPPLTRSVSAEAGAVLAGEENDKKSQLPTIRMIPHHDARASRPSLSFPIINRTLPTHDAVIRVGRYSERDNQAAVLENDPNATAPVGFKSKVVSRRHCEFWCSNGQWFVKDVKSSSGTFLNHVRLSSAGTESKPYPVNDGDIVQLGIDFKGGEEVIFRCVKIRIECNRSWQKALNNFNTSTHKRLRNLTTASRKKDSDAASVSSSECSICLNPVAPCQALFVAPCSHVWHYKCIRTLIYKEWPSFQCPNCRAYADLEADVEETEGSESDSELDAAMHASEASESNAAGPSTERARPPAELQHSTTHQTLLDHPTSEFDGDDELSSAMAGASIRDAHRSRSRSHSGNGGPSEPVAIPSSGTPLPPDLLSEPHDPIGARSATPTSTAPFALAAELLTPGSSGAVDGLSTPRNDAGPFVLDSGIDGVVTSPSRNGRRPANSGRGGLAPP
ncbi:SMAD/FHA domain-containing protein [Myriangium duriaei CBS 260.36]|uniref:RING-type E3 ubiquitin transferase n=1 Tax=Myriangium duriaei CBS 260.36 TaxID=1168546 RepID=A0A9P4ITT8_9PEZI|nr:SMAD/FHA domain-containing protein [Myriangium duriaei CBS 260.36]